MQRDIKKKITSFLKKRMWFLLFVLPVLLVMTLYLPDILKIRQIQTEITKKISTTFNCEVEVDS
ncbi:MAG: hypothetical protein U9R66_10260, partial [Thermodesulfobacteriota bacterium]|nr:hypothetical protein [Thermodesulfobacteriota bacterium]